jgi:hypothetical protein
MGTVLTFLAVGLATLIGAIIVISVIGAVFGLTVGLVKFLLFTVAPIMAVGWVVLKIFEKVTGKRRISASDQRWLNGS